MVCKYCGQNLANIFLVDRFLILMLLKLHLFLVFRRWEEMMRHLYPSQPPPMEKLIRLAPDIAEVVLNKCVRKEDMKTKGRTEYKTIYDFSYLDKLPDEQNSDVPYFGPSVMIKYRRSNLLQHPLTVRLINYKWARMGRWLYIGSLTSYILFVTLLTSLLVVEKDQ